MFGGWTAAVMLGTAMTSADGSARPSAITVNYMEKVPTSTDVVINAEPLRLGRSIEQWEVGLATLDGAVLAKALVVLTNRRPTDGHTQPAMPVVPAPEGLEVVYPPAPFGERAEHRVISGHPVFNRGDTASMHWIRETTGRPVDYLQLAFLADAYAPRSFFWSNGPRMNVTISMSIYFHATDDEIAAVGDDYVLNEAIGTRGADSTSGQQARLWSRQGALLATTEQLGWYW